MKAILVIDKPKDCFTCELGGSKVCIGGCPLKPIPKKKLVLEHRIGNLIANIYELTEAKGYNNCLDEILGETE